MNWKWFYSPLLYAECSTPNGYVGGINRLRNSNGSRTNLCNVPMVAFSLVYALIYIFHSLFIICKQILESYLKGVLFTISPYNWYSHHVEESLNFIPIASSSSSSNSNQKAIIFYFSLKYKRAMFWEVDNSKLIT